MLLQVKSIQQVLAQKAVRWLSNTIEAEVKIDEVYLKGFRDLTMEGFLIRDQKGDTISAIEQLSLQLSPMALFQNKLVFDALDVSGAVIRLHRNEEGTWNYDFISEAFALDTSIVDTIANAPGWSIEPEAIDFQTIRLDYTDEITYSQLSLDLGRLQAEVNALDIDRYQVDLSSLVIEQPTVQYVVETGEVPPPKDSTAIVFPDLGWTIQIDQTQMEGGQIYYQQSTPDTLPTAISLEALAWDVRKIEVNATQMTASIESFSAQVQDSLVITQFSTDLVFSDSMTALRDLSLRMPGISLQQSVVLDYPTLEALFLITNPSSTYAPKEIKVSASVSDLSITPEAINRFIPGLIAQETNEAFVFSGIINGSLAELNIEKIDIRKGQELRLLAQGQVKEPMDIEQLSFDVKIDTLKGSYDGLISILPDGTLPKGLANWGSIKIGGQFTGKLADFTSEKLWISAQDGPSFEGMVQISGLPDYETAQFQMQVDTLQTRLSHWSGFAPDSLLATVEGFGDLGLSGTFTGDLYQFETALQLNSAAGSLAADARFQFEGDYSNAIYQGTFQLQDFDLGKIMKDTLLGKASMLLDIEGSGLQAADWNTDIQATVSDLSYQQYEYDSLFLKGRLEAFAFDGQLLLDDPNIQFEYTGRLPLGDTVSAYQFILQLDTVNLQALGFYPSPLGLGTRVEVNIQNFSVDHLRGSVVLPYLSIEDSLQTFQTDSIQILSGVDDQGRQRLSLDSDLLQFELEGQYQLSTLPKEIAEWVDPYFPVKNFFFSLDSLIEETEVLEPLAPKTQLTAYLRMSNPAKLTKIFLPELKRLDTLAADVVFDRPEEHWDFTVYLPVLQYENYQIDSLLLESSSDERSLDSELTAQQFRSGENTVIPNLAIQTILRSDSLLVQVLSAANADSLGWEFSGGLTNTDQQLLFRVDPQIRLGGEVWKVNPDHQLTYAKNGSWAIQTLQLQKDNERIFMNAQSKPSGGSSIATLGFEQFKIAALNPFLDYAPGYMTGTLDGKAEARDFLNNLSYTANLNLQKWAVDSTIIGNLLLEAEQLNTRPSISLSAALADYGNELSAKGTYQIEEQYFEADAVIDRLKMESLDPFLVGLVHESKGYLAGKFKMSGHPDRPVIKGDLQFKEVETIIDYANTPYQITAGTISLTENKIDLGTINLLDVNNRPATISGVINHRFFDQLSMDLQFKTDRFQFLNTTAKDNELFYGQLLLQSAVSIQGPIEEPRFFIDAKTQAGTHFYVIPLTDEQAISKDDFIIFGRPALDSLGRDTNYLNNYQLTSPGIDLQLNLEMTPDATLEIIIDPLTGDRLVCKGSSNLTVDMDAGGNVAINGTYQITSGSYSFSYEQLLKREFTLLPSSKISFSGDPLRARLDITAAYQTRVLLNDLIDNQVGGGPTALPGQRANVQVQMKITGDLIEPVLSFDIVLLGEAQGSVADAARTRLEQLRNNETELNTQVFGLLLFNNFLNDQSGAVSNTGETVLLSSVSKLISNQLNRLASKLLKGVDFTLGVEAYKPGIDPSGSSGVATEVQLGLSKRLFNDRLNVKVGGNLNVNSSQEQQALTAFTGDFALEYRLAPEGNYLLRVYRRNDYDALNEGNVSRTGAGISIKKTFANKQRKRKQ